MPKKKRATALFEVMSAGRKMEPVVPRRNLFQSPPLWSMVQRFAKSIRLPKRAPRTERERTAEVEPEPVRVKPVRETVRPARIARAEKPPREPWTQWLDRLPFNLDPVNTVIAISGVIIVIGLAFLIAHKFGGEKVPTLAAVGTSRGSRAGVRPDVLVVPRRANTATVLSPDPGNNTPDPTPSDATAPATPGKRIINMNYLVIQSFNDEKIARDAADVLNKNGVDCTVSQGLSHWSKWFCIVGTKPFAPRTSDSPEFKKYYNRIVAIGNEFGSKSKWKQFNPQLYRWREDSEKQ
jgi:hypothetical protein